MEKSTVMITGASGLLGRALMTKFTSSEAWKNVIGTAFSRCGPNLLQVDLTDLDQIKARITVSSGSEVIILKPLEVPASRVYPRSANAHNCLEPN